MKQFILLLLSLLLLTSCNQTSSKKEAIATREDSLQRVQAQRDSLIKVEEGKIIADICFGISEEEYEKKEKSLLDSKTGIYESSNRVLGDVANGIYRWGNYLHNGFYGYYYQNKLYKVVTKGGGVSLSDYEYLMNKQLNALLSMFKEKYGEPKQYNGLPSWANLRVGQSRSICSWDIGNKRIILWIHESSNNYYRLNVEFVQKDIQALIEKEKEEEKKAKDKAGAELL